MLFDEADSLFAGRTTVSSSNDRYANGVVNFLLQKLESFDGVILLTTNNAHAIDPAFMRRVRFHVEFPAPEWETRRALWARLMPALDDASSPGDAAELVDALAEKFEMTGGTIKNALMRAAAAAVAAGRGLTRDGVWDACLMEVRQQGHLVRE